MSNGGKRFRVDGFGRFNAILMFHSVGGGLHDHISTDRFRAILDYLSTEYEVVDLPEVLVPSSKKRVALTFDDGYLDFYENAVPVLREFDAPATVFVIAAALVEEGFVHDDVYGYEYMDRAQVQDLVHGDLVTIGNHTRTHPDLSTLPNSAEVEAEIVGAKRELERALSTEITRFSYPYNRYDARAVETVSRSHEYAVAGSERDALALRNASLRTLPRINGAVDGAKLESTLADRGLVVRYIKTCGREFGRRISIGWS